MTDSIKTSSLVILSEILLALYPILIKTVPTDLTTQILSRLLTYSALGLGFSKKTDILSLFTTLPGLFRSLMLGSLTLAHIGTSYYAFQNLQSGVAMSLFYTYPIWNMVFSGESMTLYKSILFFIALIGVVLISYGANNNNNININSLTFFALSAALLAALTETGIYYAVKTTTEHKDPFYNMIELYPMALLLLLGGLSVFKTKIDLRASTWMPMLLFNTFIGFIGYCVRFYTIPLLPVFVFSLLSFFGIVASFGWGWLFVEEVPSLLSAIGAGCIVGATSGALSMVDTIS